MNQTSTSSDAERAFTKWHNDRKANGLPGLADRDGFIAGYLAAARAPADVAADLPPLPKPLGIIEYAVKGNQVTQVCDGFGSDQMHAYAIEYARLAGLGATASVGGDALFRNVTAVERTSDQSVRLVFTSCHQASVFERAAIAATPEAP